MSYPARLAPSRCRGRRAWHLDTYPWREDPMCGIVGYIGPRDATPIILNGLKRLEYRGYDSAGLAVLQDDNIQVRRDVGKLARLVSMVDESPVHGQVGIGHTRWATHGEPSARN